MTTQTPKPAARNKFGFAPMEGLPAGNRSDAAAAPRDATPPADRPRSPGPMGAAVREAASNLEASTEAMVDARRRNATDAKAWRAAQETGRVMEALPVEAIRTDAMTRDRMDLSAVAASAEMEELKASIRTRGQREPIEVWADDGGYHLKKGWRRLTALRSLWEETGEERFATVVARVARTDETGFDRYVDMVEENVVREDLTFAEMAQVAIGAAADPAVDEDDPRILVGRLYESLHKTKRSYVRSFVDLLLAAGEGLRWPKAVGRNLGVTAARAVASSADAEALRAVLREAATPGAQNRALAAFARGDRGGAPSETVRSVEMQIDDLKVVLRGTEARIVTTHDLSRMAPERLERAVRAFEQALGREPSIRHL